MTTPSPTRSRRSAPTTIADIAELTGVSVPTVSKVINGRSDVSAETRRRVEAAIRERGYRRSSGARSRAPLLEVIFHELESEWALEIVRGVERIARQHHLAVVLSELEGRRSPGRGWMEGVLARRPTGVIAVFSDLGESMRQQLANRGIPYVVVDPTGAPLLEVIFHELESEWALEIVRGVERVARQHHLAVVLSELEGRRSPGRGWMEGVLARRPTGVIAVFSDLGESMREQLANRGIPYVVVDPTGEPLHDTPSVGATNWNGGLTATRHLLALGHRRIGVIGGPEWILCSRARLDGYRAAMDEAGVPIGPDLISHGQFHVAEGIDRGRALLRLKDRPTAIFAGNDLQALGVYQAAREARLHIPEDLSVVGFDDLPVAQWVGPPMTTVRQPLMDMAAAAADMVVAMARGETPTQTRVELATELVVRESTAPPAT